MLAQVPRGATPLSADGRPSTWREMQGVVTAGDGDWIVSELPPNQRIHIEYARPAGVPVGKLQFENGFTVPLDDDSGNWRALDVAIELPSAGLGLARIWRDGQLLSRVELSPPAVTAPAVGFPFVSTLEQARELLRCDGDFSVVVRFRTRAGGSLFAMAPLDGPWAPNSKALFIRDGQLVYDIGWLGECSGGSKVDDGAWHIAALVVDQATATLHLDGQRLAAPRPRFTRPDEPGHVFKIGAASPDFGGDFEGDISFLRYYGRALTGEETSRLTEKGGIRQNTPDFEWLPGENGSPSAALRIVAPPGMLIRNAWTQNLDPAHHAEVISSWNGDAWERGRSLYSQLCIVCHGTRDQPGSLPTALRFGEAPFKNGADPYSMFLTLTHGFGQMVAQPQYTSRQKYDLIHYIRETFLRDKPGLYTRTDAPYLAGLPLGQATAEPEVESKQVPMYLQMDFGPVLFWTIEVEPENIAQKGIAVRLDPGTGGISRGNTWVLYDHDTLRMAAGWTGEGFVDWRGIAFDGSHQTHTRMNGAPVFKSPPGPGWANPADGSWTDPRPSGLDGKPYGPLPRSWAQYRGLHLHGERAVLSYTVGGTAIHDSPSLVPYGSAPLFVRTLNVGPAEAPLAVRLAADDPSLAVVIQGEGAALQRDAGFIVLQIPPSHLPRHLSIWMARLDSANLQALVGASPPPADLTPMTKGGPRRWSTSVTTKVSAGDDTGPLMVDTLQLPDDNPWRSWMRPTGFDFFPDGRSAAVSTWNGDVWRVDGISGSGELRWSRLATGLFQPLGVRFRGNDIFVGCRDQIARLRDLNGDGETDFIDCFNNDHQVTEHFHEFAMGLQTDAAGNFYYAKSARHALPAVVPHHGTLLRVTADGSRTDIIAHGFRAANGVCLNPDGSFFVTDQEGHWTPKNRINHVVPDGGFFGNLFGYTNVTDPSDAAMRPPLAWITNEKDRSPAELVNVPRDAWGPLGGSLLNLSYGYGRMYVVPHESVGGRPQGGVCELPIQDFPTGVMRGRFHSDGSLYACGMVGWATNCLQEGGMYRLRPTGRPFHLPISLASRPGGISLTFSDPLPSGLDDSSFTARSWSLRRSAHYGSPHLNEKSLPVTAATRDPDGRTISLAIPDLAPTHCLEIVWKGVDAEGRDISRSLHLTLHELGPVDAREKYPGNDTR